MPQKNDSSEVSVICLCIGFKTVQLTVVTGLKWKTTDEI